MKNIHLVETKNDSNLFIADTSGKLQYNTPITKGNSKNQFIYITSDEEVKEGDLCIDGKTIGYYDFDEDTCPILKDSENKNTYRFVLAPHAKKIVLTNDIKLVADGVQEIDEEFLKWYVNNPDCEFVEVEDYNSFGVDNWKYLITVPQDKIMQRFIQNAKHKGKSLTTEEVVEGRSSAYNFLDFYAHEAKTEKLYTKEEILKAQQAILGNIKEAVTNENYIIEYLEK